MQRIDMGSVHLLMILAPLVLKRGSKVLQGGQIPHLHPAESSLYNSLPGRRSLQYPLPKALCMQALTSHLYYSSPPNYTILYGCRVEALGTLTTATILY